MKANIKVTFEFTVNEDGRFDTQVRFDLPDHPGMPCPDKVKRIIAQDIQMIATAMIQVLPKGDA